MAVPIGCVMASAVVMTLLTAMGAIVAMGVVVRGVAAALLASAGPEIREPAAGVSDSCAQRFVVCLLQVELHESSAGRADLRG